MPLVRRQFLQTAAGAALSMPFAGVATAQAYPSRSVRVIVPVGAGGANDTSTRLIAQKLSESLKQQFYVENIVGAGGNIGMAQAMKTAPDGYTVLSVAPSFVINPTLNPKTPFDPVRDFAPVTLMCATPTVIVAHASLGAGTIKELIALLKANPGKFSYSSAGTGTPAHLAGELFKAAYGVDIIHVPFTGGPPAVQALMSGTVQLVTNAVPTSEALARQGTIRALAVSGAKRWPSLPDVPTLVESGYPGFVTDTFAGLFAPAGTPKEVVDKLAKTVSEVLAKPEVVEKARKAGFQVIGGGPEVLAARVVREVAFNRDIITRAGIEPR